MFIERAQRQVNRDFINHVAAQELGQSCVIAAQFETGCVECFHTGPLLVHETNELVPAFGGRLNLSRKFNGARVGAQNEHVPQVAPISANYREPVLQQESRRDHRDGADDPKDDEKLRGDHTNGEQH